MRARSVLLAGVSLSLFVVLSACGGGDQANLFGSQGAGAGTPGTGGGNGVGGDPTGTGGAATQGPGGATQGLGGATGKGGGPGGSPGGGKGGTTSQGGAAPGAGGSPPGAGGSAMMGKGGGTAGKGGTGTGGSGTAGTGTAGSGTAGSGTAGTGTAGSGTAGSGTAGTGTAGSGTAGSGTAGTGTAGSGTAGSGTAGTGTAGSGTAGSGTAGTGASGSTGTGGSGTAGAPSCDAAGSSCDACATCSKKGACAGAWDACKNSSECVALGACTKPCGTDQGCLDQCGQDHPTGVGPYNQYVDCAACVACPNACAGLVMCSASSCNPETQSGCTGADSKCTLTSSGGGGYQPTCVAPMSMTVGNGSKCVRMNNQAGYDDCGAGDFCTFLGTAEGDPNNPVRFCRAFCAGSGSCGANKTCIAIDNQTPPDAVCLPTCTPFKGQCGNGTCAGQEINVEGQGALVCRYEGNGLPGTPCGQDADCGKEHICLDGPGGKRCRGLCDATHPCLGLPCQMSSALPAGVGVCVN